MINKNEIKFGEPIYYMPSYSGTSKISVLKLLDNERVLVKPYSKNRDFKPFPTPMAHIYNNSQDAYRGRRAWESYKRKSKGAKNDRCR